MGLFNSVKIYAGKWNVKSSDRLGEDDLNMIKSAVTCSSDYGISVCFFLKKGGQFYIPLSNECNIGIGEVVPLNKVEVLTLSKDGEADIQRINVL